MLDEPHVRTLSTVKSLNILTAFNVVYLTILFMTLNTQDRLVSMFITQHSNMIGKRQNAIYAEQHKELRKCLHNRIIQALLLLCCIYFVVHKFQ
jgi:hypothetical protein